MGSRFPDWLINQVEESYKSGGAERVLYDLAFYPAYAGRGAVNWRTFEGTAEHPVAKLLRKQAFEEFMRLSEEIGDLE